MPHASFLIDHALRNVWCAPRQDHQSIVKPLRLTGRSGVFNRVTVMWENMELPQQGTRFHVFQIGQLHPRLMGLFDVQNKWVSLAEACVRMRLITDVFNEVGIQMPRFETWYRVTKDKNLIFAIKHQKTIPINPGIDDLYIRVYTNAFFQTQRENDDGLDIWITGAVPLNRQQIIQLQASYNSYLSRPGQVYAFVNGYRVNTIDLFTVQNGDVVEFVYDASIYKVVDFKVSELSSYPSNVDGCMKYLLHYEGKTDWIDFHDDLDLFLLAPLPNGRFKGVYYHRNDPTSLRMITHKDYVIPTRRIVSFNDDMGIAHDPETLTLRMHIRKGGWNRSLIHENNRIRELYELPDDLVKNAMLGVNANVENWRAETLEASPYVALMRNINMDIKDTTVQDAYGYNACSKIYADSPSIVYIENDQPQVKVPYGCQGYSTAWEYDMNGSLLGFNIHAMGDIYFTRNAKTRYVEFINAMSDDMLDEAYGRIKVAYDSSLSYRYYICDIVNGVPVNNWKDVTGSNKYEIIDGFINWLVDTDLYYTLVRSDQINLAYSFSVKPTTGCIRFTLQHRARRGDDVSMWNMQIPMGELDIWLNKKHLIEGLDYFVKFPEVVITNKNHLEKVETKAQDITVRFSGFCDSDMGRSIKRDVGFVSYGMLSRNHRYNIRMDKVLMITAGGAYKDRRELLFSEDNPTVSIGNVPNGTPYQIRDVVVPVRGLTATETYAFRKKALAIDKVVEDYLSQYVLDEEFKVPSDIKERYEIVSPFFNRLIWALKSKAISDERLYLHYGDDLVRELCEPYMDLLAFDPTQEANPVDENYVVVTPHHLTRVLGLDIYHWKFLSMVNKLFLKNKLNMNNYLYIFSAGEQ